MVSPCHERLWCICVLEVSILPLSTIFWILGMFRIIFFHITLPLSQKIFLSDLGVVSTVWYFFHITRSRPFSQRIVRFLELFFSMIFFFSFYYSTIRYFHDSLIAKTYWPVITRSMCKIIRNKAGYERFTTNMSFDAAIYQTKTHGTSNLQNIEDSSSKLEWNINYNYSADRIFFFWKIWCEKSTIITKQIAEMCLKILYEKSNIITKQIAEICLKHLVWKIDLNY